MKNRRTGARARQLICWNGHGIYLALVLLSAICVRAQQPTLLGDLDADAKPTVIDLQKLLNHLTPDRDEFHLVPNLVPYADVNEDGYLNQSDVTMLRDAVLGIPLPVNTRPVALEPATGSGEVGVTVRPKAMFPKPIDLATLNSNNFYATFAGRRLAATITPAANGTFAWLFFRDPMPGASQIQVTVDGNTLRTRTGLPLDADGDGALGGIARFNFSTVSVAPIPGTVLSSRVVDPGPDLIPRTADDVVLAAGYQYLLPIAGVKVYVLGMESNFTFTDANGRFTLTNVPVGNVKVALDGRTATNAPDGYYFPEMVMDTTFEPGITNGVMNIVDANGNVVRDANGIPIHALAMYLPRVPSSILQTVSAANPTVITLNSNAAYNLPASQQQYLTMEITPGSLIGMDGQPMSSAQVGISVVPPELVKDMLPPGLLQLSFTITVQAPGVATFATPVPMTFPNIYSAPPGTKLLFLSFNHETGRLEINGTCTVSEDGLFIQTDPGSGVTHPGWHGVPPPGSPASASPPLPPPPPPPPCRNPPCCPFDAATASGRTQSENLRLACKIGASGGFLGGLIVGGVADTVCDFLPPILKQLCGKLTGDAQDKFLRDVIKNGDACGEVADKCTEDYINWATGGSSSLVGNRISPPIHPALISPTANSVASSFEASFDSYTDALSKVLVIQSQAYAILDPLRGGAVLTDSASNTLHLLLSDLDSLTGGRSVPEFLVEQGQVLQVDAEKVAKLYGLDVPTPHRFLLVDLNSGFELRGESDSLGNISGLFLSPSTQYRLYRYFPGNPNILKSEFASSKSGSATTLPNGGVSILDQTDADGDGLSDLAEQVLGTNPLRFTTANDGISDSAKVAAGLDPLSARGFPTGVIASLPLPGEAKEVVLEGALLDSQQQTAYLALGSRGLGIVDVSQFQKPIFLGQLELTGDASDVAVDSNLRIAAVAANAGGLHLVNVADPMQPALLQTIPGLAVQVEVLNGVAYAAFGNTLRAYDLLTGEQLQSLAPGNYPFTGLAREGAFLYTMDALLTLRAIDISGTDGFPMVARGSRVMPAGRGRLFVGNGIAFIAAQNSSGGGFATADVSNPDNLTVLSGVDLNLVAGRHLAINGSSLAVAVGHLGFNQYAFDVLNVSDPANTGGFITRFSLAVEPASVSIGGGIAFVAGGNAGLQVVNYRSFDNQGVPPVLNVVPPADVDPAPGIQVEEGGVVRLGAQLVDDVQVRNVELLLDGQVVVNDVSFPWDLSARMPLLSSGASNATLQMRATDTGGNTTTSSVFTVTLVPDHTPPVVRRVTPASGAIAGSINLVGAYFSEPVDESTLGGTLTLTWAGADDVFATSDDVAINDGTLTYREDLRAVFLSFSANLFPGVYRASVSPPLRDLAGNTLAQAVTWQFWVMGGQDSDHDGIPDAIEQALGLDPNNPDSNGNGISDGDDDLDGDGLPNSFEILLGYDPRLSDSNGNNVPDGAEDFDHDGLTNLQERQFGTNPRLADTDGDGWNDETEVTAGSSPLSAASRPLLQVMARPPVRVVLPTLADLNLPANTTVARPPVGVLLPSLSDPGLPANTFLARPPVSALLPSFGDANLPANTTVGQPQVKVKFDPQ